MEFISIHFWLRICVGWAHMYGVFLLPVMVASDPCVPPGDFLNGSSGLFTSPNFSNNFPANINCTWNITVPTGLIIKLTFFSFTLEPGQSKACTGDSQGARIFITNVASDDGNQVFQMCGQQLPDPVYSVGNSILVRLRSLSNVYSGFNASYEAIDGELLCPRGITLTGTPGVITSPFFPRMYPDNQNCSWQITARQGNRVKLVIASSLGIQVNGSQYECTCDYLKVENGFTVDHENEKICSFPNKIITYYSNLESLKVLFVSDDTATKQYDGFKATYTQLNYTPPICPSEAIPLSGNGKLSSPNYPMSNYNASMNCSWIITVPSEKQVKFVFTELALGLCEDVCSSGNCTYVELYDGASTSSPSLGRFCNGSVLQDVWSRGNQMFVQFRSGSSLDRGFKAQYSVSSGRPTTTPSSGRPTTTSSSGRSTATPSSGRPTTTPSSGRPTTTPSSGRPTTTPSSGRPTTTSSSARSITTSFIGIITPSQTIATPSSAVTAPTSAPSSDVYQIEEIETNQVLLELAKKEFLSNGNKTRYIQIIVIQLKDNDQDIGNSTDEKYAAKNIDKDCDTKEEGEAYITAEFDYGKTEFTIGDEKHCSRSKEGSRKYLNGELEPNTYYAVFQRSFDDYGAYDSEKFLLFKTKTPFRLVAVVVAVVVAVIVAAVLVAICIYFYKVKKSRQADISSLRDLEMSRINAAADC